MTNIFQDKINRFAKLPKSLKSWLEKNPVQKDFAARKSNVVVSAPQLRVQDEYAEAAAPVPKLADSLDLDSILSGEGVNLDDDKVMAKYMNVAHLSAQSGTSDAVSADFSPVAQAAYDVAGVAQIEQESALHTVAAPYSNTAANILEQADVFVKTLPAYSASVEQPDVRQL